MGWCESKLGCSPPSRLGKLVAKSPYGRCSTHRFWWIDWVLVCQIKQFPEWKNNCGSFSSCAKKYNVYDIPKVPGTCLNIFQCNQIADWFMLRNVVGKQKISFLWFDSQALSSLPEPNGFSPSLYLKASLSRKEGPFTNECLSPTLSLCS